MLSITKNNDKQLKESWKEIKNKTFQKHPQNLPEIFQNSFNYVWKISHQFSEHLPKISQNFPDFSTNDPGEWEERCLYNGSWTSLQIVLRNLNVPSKELSGENNIEL